MVNGSPLEDHLDERQLIARVLAGDPSAERTLYDAHVDRVYSLSFRLTGDPGTAEECVQETFIRVFANLDRFQGQSQLSTWIHSIALSVVRTGFRKAARRSRYEAELTDVTAARARGPRNTAPLRHRLHAAIDGLPERMRTAFVMHEIEGYTHQEIAETMDVPVGTIKTRVFRAREALRRVLDPPEPGVQEQ